MKNRFLFLAYLLLCCLFFTSITWSQENPLNKKITIKANQISVEKALNSISSRANIFFSYNSDIIPLDSLVNLNFEKTEVTKILNQLLGNNFIYKTTGQHVIILKKKLSPKNQQEKVIVKGSVIEFGTGFKLANASIYHISGKEETLSNEEGIFSMSLMPKGDYISLAINKSNYNDTIVFIKSTETQKIEIALKTELIAISSIAPVIDYNVPAPNVEQSKFVPKFVRKDMILHALNIKFFKEIPVQFSLIPFVGTNRKLSGSMVNKFSFNLLGGYSYGLDGIEIGGFVNINRKQVKGLQISGFGNITGDKTDGVQVAGFFNHNFGKMKGVQISGFYNLVNDSLDGAQIAGFANILNGKMDGAQIAGFANITTSEVKASQISGFVNLALKDNKGSQVSGFANITNGNQGGIQSSGFANFVRGNMKGAQIAGFANITIKDVTWAQVSGFINYARKVKGSQIGVVNIADTVSGAPFGIFNFIRKGLHQVSIYTDENGGADVSLSLGTYRFYTIFGASTNYFSKPNYWGAFMGFGTRLWGSRMISFDINATVASINVGNISNWFQSRQSKLSGDLNLRLSKHFLIFAGPSYNVFRYNSDLVELADYPKNYLSSTLFNKTSGGTTSKGWIGGQFGLKFKF
jgi:hypothetical protein